MPRSCTTIHSLPGWPGFHQEPRLLVQLATALKKQPAKADRSTVAVKLDSAFIKLCVCEKKSNFLSWVIRMVFVDPVTNGDVNAIVRDCLATYW